MLDEQKALLNLRSKHVVQLFDVLREGRGEDERISLIMEKINGEIIDDMKYNADEKFLKDIWQISCGLSDIHNAGIIHRDIKPSNIMKDKEGVIKIIDFGLSRGDGDEAKTKNIIGTLGFMAPELWRGATISFDSSIDIYAFGITALKMLGIRLPREMRRQPPDPYAGGAFNSFAATLSADIIYVLDRCLQYDASNRPRIDEVQGTIERHLLNGKHQGLFVSRTKSYQINAEDRKISLRYGNDVGISVEYNGLDFVVNNVDGTVRINNKVIKKGYILSGCSVVTMQASGGRRGFITFDISHPEVMT